MDTATKMGLAAAGGLLLLASMRGQEPAPGGLTQQQLRDIQDAQRRFREAQERRYDEEGQRAAYRQALQRSGFGSIEEYHNWLRDQGYTESEIEQGYRDSTSWTPNEFSGTGEL